VVIVSARPVCGNVYERYDVRLSVCLSHLSTAGGRCGRWVCCGGTAHSSTAGAQQQTRAVSRCQLTYEAESRRACYLGEASASSSSSCKTFFILQHDSDIRVVHGSGRPMGWTGSGWVEIFQLLVGWAAAGRATGL